MPSVNEELADALIRHSTFLQRFGGNAVKRVIALLNRADIDLVEQIEGSLSKGTPEVSTAAGRRRLEAVLRDLRALNRAAYDKIGKELSAELSALAEYEAEWHTDLLEEKLPAVVAVNAVSPQQVASAALARPFQGRLLQEALSGLETAQAARVRDAIRLGIVEGQTTDQIVRRIRGTRARKFADGLLDVGRRDAAAVVRTAVNHVSNHAKEAVYSDNADLIAQVEWLATLDTRTCPTCAALDGKTFDVGKGRRPPAHFNCRCTSIPVTKSWRQLGIDADELSPGTRASMNGQVPAKMTYGEWLKKQPASLQDEILGPSKGALFRTGELSVDRFVDRFGNELSLKELGARQPVAFAKAGLSNPFKPPRGEPADSIAKFLESPSQQRALLKRLYEAEGQTLDEAMGFARSIKASERYRASALSIAAARYYTGRGYRSLNERYRRSGGTLEDRQLGALVAQSLSGLRRPQAPILRAPSKTMDHADRWWGQASDGKFLDVGRQFQSYSETAEVAADWTADSDLLFRIKNPTHGARLEPITQFPGQDEVLLPPGLKYRVTGKGRETIQGREFRVIDLEIVE